MAKTPADIRSLARAHTVTALNVLKRIMGSPKAPASARVAAAQALLDRGWGKAPQPISGDEDNPLKIERVLRVIICAEPEGLGDQDRPSLPAPN